MGEKNVSNSVSCFLAHSRLRFNNTIVLGSPQNWTVLKRKQNKRN